MKEVQQLWNKNIFENGLCKIKTNLNEFEVIYVFVFKYRSIQSLPLLLWSIIYLMQLLHSLYSFAQLFQKYHDVSYIQHSLQEDAHLSGSAIFLIDENDNCNAVRIAMTKEFGKFEKILKTLKNRARLNLSVCKSVSVIRKQNLE